MQSTYCLEKVLKIIFLYVSALLCTLQHIVIHAMQLSGVNSPNFSTCVPVPLRKRGTFLQASFLALAYQQSSIQDLVKKWHTTGSVANANKNRAPSVRTPAVIADIQARMIRSPTKSTRKLSQQTNVSRRSCQRVLQFLQMKPYRMTCVQELKQEDKAKRVYYCTWLLQTIVSGLLDPLLYFMSDEAWFHLSGHLNSQNTRYWSVDNPNTIHQQLLHDPKNRSLVCAIFNADCGSHIFLNNSEQSCVYGNIWEILRTTDAQRMRVRHLSTGWSDLSHFLRVTVSNSRRIRRRTNCH